MTNIREVLKSFKEACKQKNIRLTPQRLAIYKTLYQAGSHPSSEEVYDKLKKRFPSTSLNTVYRSLTLFAENKLIREIRTYGAPKRFDTNILIHHHIICGKCGKVQDTYLDLDIKELLPKKIEGLSEINAVNIYIEGKCEKCT